LATLPISTRLITELHAELLAGVRGRERNPGELRRSQNWIGPPGATVETATFVPPPPDALAALLSDWEHFTNATPTELPLLVQCGLVHYQFETIHPFLDGNGRLGRLLIVFFHVAKGRLPSPIL
jgi:Fic family protein